MFLDILAIFGFILGGYILPELAFLLGSGKYEVPTTLNIISAVAFGLVSANVLLGGY